MRFPIDGGFKIPTIAGVLKVPPSRSGISVPAFCVHTYFAPGGVCFTVG